MAVDFAQRMGVAVRCAVGLAEDLKVEKRSERFEEE